jgi:hypothetical protein
MRGVSRGFSRNTSCLPHPTLPSRGGLSGVGASSSHALGTLPSMGRAGWGGGSAGGDWSMEALSFGHPLQARPGPLRGRGLLSSPLRGEGGGGGLARLFSERIPSTPPNPPHRGEGFREWALHPHTDWEPSPRWGGQGGVEAVRVENGRWRRSPLTTLSKRARGRFAAGACYPLPSGERVGFRRGGQRGVLGRRRASFG